MNSNSAAMDIDGDNLPLDEADWINTSRKWPTNPPVNLVQFREAALTAPEDHKFALRQLYDRPINISALLAMSVPAQGATLDHLQVTQLL